MIELLIIIILLIVFPVLAYVSVWLLGHAIQLLIGIAILAAIVVPVVWLSDYLNIVPLIIVALIAVGIFYRKEN